MLELGSLIGGRLRIDRIIGAGGMGVVAAATHVELDQQVAVKVLRDELASDPTIVERFIREARAVARLRTEHVCRVFDVGRLASGAPYIVMELLAGADLASAIAQRPLPTTIAAEYVLQACVALAEAHAAGIVHRDLKPANLFVTRQPDGGPLVKVLDFGIAKAMASDAKLTHTTSAMGSPGYMSPEQVRSARDVDARSDIWSLGVTLYQLISGRFPFPGTQLTEIAVKITTEPPAPLDTDPRLAAVVMRCLEKSPDRRYPDVTSLAAELVPFAGPSARKLAQRISPIPTTPVPAPVAPPIDVAAPTAASTAAAPTAMSIVASPTVAPAIVVPPVTASPPRRRRALVIAAALLAVAGAGIAIAWRRSSTPQATAVVRDAATADPWRSAGEGTAPPFGGVLDARPLDAAPADAAPNDAAPNDAAPNDAAPRTAGSLDTTNLANMDVVYARTKQGRAAFQMMLGMAEAKLHATPNDRTWLRNAVQAACYLGDATKAQTYYARVPAGDRKSLAKLCAHNQVTLVEPK